MPLTILMRQLSTLLHLVTFGCQENLSNYQILGM